MSVRGKQRLRKIEALQQLLKVLGEREDLELMEALIPHLPTFLLPSTLVTISKINNFDDGKLVTALTHSLPTNLNPNLLAAALASVQNISDPYSYSKALVVLA